MRWLRSLADILKNQYSESAVKSVLKRATSLTKRGEIQAEELSYPKAMCQNTLSHIYYRQFKISADQNHLLEAVLNATSAVQNHSVPPAERVAYAANAGEIYLDNNDFKNADHMFSIAIENFVTASPRSLSYDDQQYIVAKFSGLASKAAAVKLTAYPGNDEAALSLLEAGRGVIAGLLLDIRSDIHELRIKLPSLADDFDRLRNILDVSEWHGVDSFDPSRVSVANLIKYEKAQQDFNELLEKIRTHQGFDDYLKLPSPAAMKNQAKKYGPIVLFNASEIRSDAFIVTEKRIHTLPLRGLQVTILESKAKKLINDLRKLNILNFGEVNQGLLEVLEWLWEEAVGPVLNELEITNPPSEGQEYPRIWWVPGGWLSLLPIHAAGFHMDDLHRNVLDLVVSSYTPTIRTMGHLEEKFQELPMNRSLDGLLVEMTETPDQEPLPRIADEVKALKDIIAPILTLKHLTQPDKKSVLDCLERHQVVHFACHGESDARDPSKSLLLLSDWYRNPLTVSDIIRKRLNNSKLAYLSACKTASNLADSLLDEGIHIAAGFQMAGFQHVIGTLWETVLVLTLQEQQ
ncbi:hypothetical protein IFM51744_10810 [Aspergillus udagawae]|nr:hypothetical protein IFM51744_10810 [Aspergillus udagawae]